MAARPVVRLEVHETDVRPGLWCDRCLLPSVVELDQAFVVSATLRVIGRQTVRWCEDCGEHARHTRP